MSISVPPTPTPMNPIVDYGTTNGVPDCLYAQAHITGMDVGKATINLASLTLRPGTNRIRVLLNGLHSNIVLVSA